MKYTTYSPEEKPEIQAVFRQAFSDAENEEEGRAIATLVDDLITSTPSQDVFGYVAKKEQDILASIFFSRLRFENSTEAFLLSPVAVLPNFQRQGIGQSLLRHGISEMQSMGVELLFTYGDPKYYSKVGFKEIKEKAFKAPFPLSQPEGWLCQALTENAPTKISGGSQCVRALSKPEYW